jgi:putative ABC transport system substrate-binding protein
VTPTAGGTLPRGHKAARISREGSAPRHTGQIGALAAKHAIPAVAANREFAAAGDLLSYGADIAESYRLAGIYTGRILKSDKPADLPVHRAAKVELIINLKAAKALGIIVPIPLLGHADEGD